MGWGRRYFAVQAVAGAAWWIAVLVSPLVRESTLGNLDPVPVALADVPLFVGGSAVAALGARWAVVVATGWTGAVTVALAGYATLTTEAGLGVLLMTASTAGSLVAASAILLGRVPTEWLFAGPLATRPADPRRTTAVHVAATALQIVVFWSLLLGLVPLVLSALVERWRLAVPFPAVSAPVGVTVFLAASLLGLLSAAAMSTRGGGTPLPAATAVRLVIAGPYRVVRNPMAVAGIAQGVAVGLVLGSWTVVVYALAGALLWNQVVRPYEEADLEERFGDDFRRYRAMVRCWWPVLRAYRAEGPAARTAATDG